MPDLLYYLPSASVNPGKRREQALLLEGLAASLGLSVRSLRDQDLERSPGELLAENELPPAGPEDRWEEVTSPFLYIALDDPRRLSDFFGKLRSLREQGLLHFPLKAARTESNLNWSLRYLLKELSQEHAWFSAMERLKALANRAAALPEAERPEGLSAALRETGELFRSPQSPPTEAAMEKAASRLEKLLP